LRLLVIWLIACLCGGWTRGLLGIIHPGAVFAVDDILYTPNQLWSNGVHRVNNPGEIAPVG
jgi:hypothetical protein